MARYRHVLDNALAHVKSLWIVIGIQTIVILVMGFGLARSTSDLTIHIPPDLKAGATVKANAPAPSNVYAFGIYIFQQLYRWPEDGATDFSKAIYQLSPYLTPSYREALVAELELKAKRGELLGRERGMQELPGHGFTEERVHVLQDGIWLVLLDMELLESVKGMDVKHKRIRYPLRVVRYDIDRETNPWGLALDGFEAPGPKSLVDEVGEGSY